jgi:surface carbohydrate biosynthesis protein
VSSSPGLNTDVAREPRIVNRMPIRRHLDVSPRRWLYVRITIKPREFDGGAMLAFEAAERGWGVIFGKDIYLSESNLPRGVLIEKGVMPGRAQKLTDPLNAGQKIAAICEEGLIYSNVNEYGRRRLERKAFELLDLFFCWGKNQAHDVVETLGYDAKKVAITGNPRFDLHRPELRVVFSKKVDRIRRKHGRFILITTKFSRYNGITEDYEKKIANARRIGKILTTEHEDEMRGLREFHRVGFESFVKLIHELSRRHPDVSVVVRPHPSENHDRWHEVTAGLQNVKVIFEGNVIEWILASEILVHNNCTTGVEAYFLGKPAISYRPISDPRFDMYLPNALSIQSFDLTTTQELVGAVLAGQGIQDESQSERAETARYFLANAEGKLACERMMDALDSVALAEQPLSVSTPWMADLRNAVSRNLGKLHRSLTSREAKARLRFQTQKFDGLRKSELLERLRSAQRVTGRYGGIKAVKIAEDVFCIYK